MSCHPMQSLWGEAPSPRVPRGGAAAAPQGPGAGQGWAQRLLPVLAAGTAAHGQLQAAGAGSKCSSAARP